ncbi:unnamed protein product [Rotaria sordida]|uniref:Adenosine deaminase domain-containing protein n=1 Tax=Rotaria sordida TaxID=392033 RepID=A0A815H1G6_9BILA|nr:unnamed protein product [Rotaria sordida]
MIRWINLILLFYYFSNVNPLPLPYNQYSYMLARNKIKQNDEMGPIKHSLNKKEVIVNFYLEWIRTNEFIRTRTYFYPARPIETEIENITNNPLYQLLKLFPKGGNLHIHESQVLDRKLLLESILNSEEDKYLYICDQENCTTNKYFLSIFRSTPSNDWTKVKDSNWTVVDILKKTTLIGILNDLRTPIYPTDSRSRWHVANSHGVFDFYDDVIRYNTTRFNYMRMVLDNALEENIQLLEFRRNSFGTLFYYDDNGTKILIDPYEELNRLTKFKNDYMKNNPKLIDFVFLMHALRFRSEEQVKNDLKRFVRLQQAFPDFVRGYDLVGEEDQGHTLLFHSHNLMEVFNESFAPYLHAGETNWPEEHILSNDVDGVSTFENIYDALIFRTRRIGHGLSLIKRPDLYKYIRQYQIPIEICLASNQILGYTADLRNHPGITYHRSGIPIVLAGDDPGSFGYNQLTVDYYLATMAWALNLADLKQIARNSIQYSSIPIMMKEQDADGKTNNKEVNIDGTNEIRYPIRDSHEPLVDFIQPPTKEIIRRGTARITKTNGAIIKFLCC